MLPAAAIAGSAGDGAVPTPSRCSASRYLPNPLPLSQPPPDSTAVPAIQSLKELTSCHGAREATIWRMDVAKTVRSRGCDGACSARVHAPGLIEKLCPARNAVAAPPLGDSSYQLFASLLQACQPVNAGMTRYSDADPAVRQRRTIEQPSWLPACTKTTGRPCRRR